MGKRLRRARLSALVALAVWLSACGGVSSIAEGTAGQPHPIPTAASSAAEIYLQTAFFFVRDNYYYANQVDWSALERKVFLRAQSARTPSETYPAIDYLLSALRPSLHTFFQTPEVASLYNLASGEFIGFGFAAVRQAHGLTVIAHVWPDSAAARAGIQSGDVILQADHRPPPTTPAYSTFTSYGSTVTLQLRQRNHGSISTVRLRAEPYQSNEPPTGRLLPGSLGYLNLPSFAGADPEAQSYSSMAQSDIQSIEASSPCGWIVDLRLNIGGDFDPMVAGVGPILGNGPAGSLVQRTGLRIPWSYQDGSLFVGSQETFQVANAYDLPRADPPVAVLTSSLTASAGEATLISFLGRPNTRTFGQPTAGAPSAPVRKNLSDGAVIAVVSAIDADRAGHVFQDLAPIRPEQAVTTDWAQIGLNSDPTLEAAEAWLKAQPACTA